MNPCGLNEPRGLPNPGHRRSTEMIVALYAVTGAAGFIGSHLVDALLAAGHQVRGLDDLSTGRRENLDPRCELLVGDVAEPDATRAVMQGVDGCFHLAAIASVVRTNEDWNRSHRVNLGGSVNVFEAARDAGRVPVVYASSAAVYGDTEGLVASEKMAPRPLSSYGADKLGSELQAQAGWHVHRLPSFGLRFFNVYGTRQDPGSPYSGVISIFARRVAAGHTIDIHGDGRQVRDFVHVSDVVAHLQAAMRRTVREKGAAVANVCTGHGTTVLELAGALGDIHHRSPDLHFLPQRAGDIRRSIGNPALAVSLLGYKAKVGLVDGLAELAGLISIAA
jgi:UDP-glucose 4-epimerase